MSLKSRLHGLERRSPPPSVLPTRDEFNRALDELAGALPDGELREQLDRARAELAHSYPPTRDTAREIRRTCDAILRDVDTGDDDTGDGTR